MCTVVARNYLAHARVLAESFLRHHPQGHLSVLVLDADENADLADEPFEVLRPDDIGLDGPEFRRMATIYQLLELATAVKPWLLRHALDDGAAAVVYLDPDVEVFAPLDDLGALAREHGMVLTPHMLEPMTSDDRYPSEIDILDAGVFNLGFMALGPASGPVLDWWQQHLRRHCLNDPANGYFVDQRWMDLGATLFHHHVLRDPGCNVAYWNLDRRHLTWTDDGYLVDGAPLRFFHFSGFPPERPWVLSTHQRDRPRVLCVENIALARLCQQHADRLHFHDHQRWSQVPYRFDVAENGQTLDRAIRRSYRVALLAHEAGEGAGEPPGPFDPLAKDAFSAWCDQLAPAERMPRLDPDIRSAAHLADRVARPVAKQMLRMVGFSPSSASDLVRSARRRARNLGHHLDARPAAGGVNVFGHFKAESGVGEVGRLVVDALRESGIPFTTTTVDGAAARQLHPFEAPARRDRAFDTNIVCVNADVLPSIMKRIGQHHFSRHRNIGVWAWELETFPQNMQASARLLDEIWVHSTHAATAVAATVPNPVSTFPIPVVTPTVVPMVRRQWGLPDSFLFLFCFDVMSVVDRKNPLGVIEAFCLAFEPGEGPVLLIKSLSAQRDCDAIRRLYRAAGSRPDVVLVDGYLGVERQRSLIDGCDAYVSLHRAEGFGLMLAEAMALGKPVIATGYSGNLDFMDNRTSWLVPHALAPVPPTCAPYQEGVRWAEPDIAAAARILREVYEHQAEAKSRAEAAQRTIVSTRTYSVATEFLTYHLGVSSDR